MLKQITPEENIVNIATSENLNLGFWKYQNAKEFNRAIKEARKNTIQSIFLLPSFEAHVRKHEILWDKPRTEFNILEKVHIDTTYIQN